MWPMLSTFKKGDRGDQGETEYRDRETEKFGFDSLSKLRFNRLTRRDEALRHQHQHQRPVYL